MAADRLLTAEAGRGALPIWLGSRLAVLLASLAAVRVIHTGPADRVPSLLDAWYHWDTALFIKVAQYGYLSPAYPDHTEVDFPGLPLVLRAVHLVVRNWIVSGLLISVVAGVATSMALWQLAEDDRRGSGRIAVAALVVFPYAVFLFAGYSEGLFLGFAVPAWLAARRQRWLLASVLGAGATSTRVTGIAFGLALAVEYLVQQRRAGGLLDRQAPWLVLPAVPVIGYVVYLHARTGHWDAYTRAQKAGWGRSFAAPWTAWSNTWHQALNLHQGSDYLWYWRAELCAALIGVLLTAVLIRDRRWGEATFVSVNLLVMTSTSYFASGVRGVLVWFPLYLLASRALLRRPHAQLLLLCTSAPLMLALTGGFVSGAWLD